MDGINRVFIMGNLGADPELKISAQGRAVMKLNIATSESWVDKESNIRSDKTEWHRITVFGKQAEGLAKFVRKGWKVFVEGRIEHSTYEKEGQKHYATDIIGLKVHALGAPRGADAGAAADPFSVRPPSNGAYDARPPALAEIPF